MGQPVPRYDARAKGDRHAHLRVRRRAARTSPTPSSSSSAHRQGPHQVLRPQGGARPAGRARHPHAREHAATRSSTMKFFTEGGPASNTRRAARLARDRLWRPDDRGRAGQQLRGGARRRAPHRRRLRDRQAVGDLRLARRRRPGARDAEQEARGPEGRRLRGGLRGRAGQGRRRLFDADAAPQPDRAVHHAVLLERRRSSRSTSRARTSTASRTASRRSSASMPSQIRVVSPFIGGAFGSKGGADAAHRHRRDRGPQARPAGQARADARAGLHHRDLPGRDAAQDQARRRRATASCRRSATRASR